MPGSVVPEARLRELLARIDALHATDPRKTETPEGTRPVELLYAERMSARLEGFHPGASPELRVAVRAQHLLRWKIPRTDYPATTAGYHRWRTDQKRAHAERVGSLLEELGFAEAFNQRVQDLVMKRKLSQDPEAQTLEDVACLVFLEHEFAAFAKTRGPNQLVDILQKTMKKMSPRGLVAANAMSMPDYTKTLIDQAASTLEDLA